jgi:hypothetical protein
VIRLRLDTLSLDKISCDTAIIAFSEDDSPLTGSAAHMDRCLGGEASRLLEQGYLKGAWESQALVASWGRVAADNVLFAGLGSQKGLVTHELTDRMEKIVQRVMMLAARTMAMNVLPQSGPRDEYDGLVADTVNGALRGATGYPYDVNIIICEPDPRRYEELVAVAQRIVFRRVKGREVSIEVLV